jgi:hypothetical protein
MKSADLIESKIKSGILFLTMLCTAISACAQRHRNAPPEPTISQQPQQLMRRLEEAEEINENDARDPRIDLVRREDFFEQAAKAERALRKLLYGYDLEPEELTEALAVPPKHLSPKLKAELLRQLQDSIALNDRREQEMLNNSFSAANFDPGPFDQQKALAAAVIRELTIGEDVHWDTLQAALRVLPAP